MRMLAFTFGLALASMAGAALMADEKKPAAAVRPAATAKSNDEEAIRATAAAFLKAFDAADAKALAALWTPAGDYIDENGQSCQGREALEKKYASLFRDHPGLKMTIEIGSIRLLGPNAAMEDGKTVLETPDGRKISASRYTAIHAKENGKWLISAVRDMPLEATSKDALKALSHFVGDWVAKRDDATVQTHCEWIADQHFLQRTYKVEKKGAEVSSGMQIIGWDPGLQKIRSWTFDSTGGHGEGEWTAVDGGWMIESAGVLADGELTASTDMLRQVEDNIIGWRSVDRVAGGQRLSDTEEVVLERRPTRAE